MVAFLASLVLVFDADERHPFTTVRGTGPAVAYTREAPGGWTQHWLYSPQNPHDRGIVRTGRHAGDWELVQSHPEKGIVLSQHSGAERCPGPLGTVYVANGSHAPYFRPGVRDRMFPDPNDEADGRGARVRARRGDHRGLAGLDAPALALGRRARPLPGRVGLPARPRLPGRALGRS